MSEMENAVGTKTKNFFFSFFWKISAFGILAISIVSYQLLLNIMLLRNQLNILESTKILT